MQILLMEKKCSKPERTDPDVAMFVNVVVATVCQQIFLHVLCDQFTMKFCRNIWQWCADKQKGPATVHLEHIYSNK